MKQHIASAAVFALLLSGANALAQDIGLGDEAVYWNKPTGWDRPGANADANNRRARARLAARGGISYVEDGKIGLGISRTLAGTVGGELELFLGDKLLITALVHISHESADAADSTSIIVIAGGAFYRLAGAGRTALMGGGRLALGYGNGTATDFGEDTVQINLEVPLRIELWLSKLISIHFEAGLLVSRIGQQGSVMSPSTEQGNTLVFALSGELFGAGGITAYLF